MAFCKALRQNLLGGVEDSRIENFVTMVSLWAKNQHWHLRNVELVGTFIIRNLSRGHNVRKG